MINLLGTTPEQQEILNAEFLVLAKKENLLPIKVSSFYKSKIDDEIASLGHTDGPLHRAVYPTNERLSVRDAHEVADFVGDRENMPDNNAFMVRKYRERMLFFSTNICLSNCQYCFRQDILSKEKENNNTLENLYEFRSIGSSQKPAVVE